jgi:ribosomal protein L32
MKWVALFSLLLPFLYLVFGPLSAKMMVVMCLGNYLLFFGPAFLRNRMDQRQTANRRARFQLAQTSETLHRCETCGATEISHPEAEFRVTATGQEFCLDHLPSRKA